MKMNINIRKCENEWVLEYLDKTSLRVIKRKGKAGI